MRAPGGHPISAFDGTTPALVDQAIDRAVLLADAPTRSITVDPVVDAPRLWTDTVFHDRPIVGSHRDPVVPPDRAAAPFAAAAAVTSNGPGAFAGPISPGFAQEVTFLNGLNPDGTISSASFWGINDDTARK